MAAHGLISIERTAVLLHDGATILDTREAYRRLENIVGARHIPLGKLLADPGLVRDAGPVVVVDDDERLEAFAARFLRGHGIDAHAVAGGASALARAL